MRQKSARTHAAKDHAPMHEIVYDRLRKALFAGEFLPGQRLVIRDLAKMLGTSIMPVREALRRLEAENALEAKGGRTLRVPILTADKYEELCLIRAELEGLAAYEAAKIITTKNIKQLEKYSELTEQARRQQDAQNIALYNRLFHQTIIRASQKPLLLKMIDSLWLQVGPQMAHTFKTTKFVFCSESDTQNLFHPHHQAIHALKVGNANAAKAAIMYDIECVCRIIAENMRAVESKSHSPNQQKGEKTPTLPQINLPITS